MTKLTVDPSLCGGCMSCSIAFPQAFKYNSDEMQSYVYKNCLTDEEAEKAIDGCPSHAISKVEE